jgi:hypothetical protein
MYSGEYPLPDPRQQEHAPQCCDIRTPQHTKAEIDRAADGTPPVSSVECLFLVRRDTPEGPQTTRSVISDPDAQQHYLGGFRLDPIQRVRQPLQRYCHLGPVTAAIVCGGERRAD